ncbi:hypothetical protein DTO063F5_1145 [Paecilomyces variotii]|nr:hypothetical protein DTO063F5_1145 [Paecilomyces variotii]
MEEVLQNINRLNRNLEGIIAVGNEFSSVEALWSQFENFMGRDGEEGAGEGHAEGEAQDDHDQHEDSRVEESGRGSATGIKDER